MVVSYREKRERRLRDNALAAYKDLPKDVRANTMANLRRESSDSDLDTFTTYHLFIKPVNMLVDSYSFDFDEELSLEGIAKLLQED